jgi:hypothetical protein
MKEIRFNYPFIILLIFLFLCAVLSNYYHYYYLKDYSYAIELKCDSNAEKCLTKDCDAEDCHQGEVVFYKQYFIKSNDYHKCLECKGSCGDLVSNCL